MSRALGPRPSITHGGSAAGWVVLIGCWSLVAVCGLIWAAARLAAVVTGGTTESFGIKFASDVLNGRTAQAWPHTPTAVVAATAVVLIGCATALAIGGAWVIARWQSAPGDPVAALARNPRMRALTRLAAARSATALRSSLTNADPREVEPAHAGLALGQLMRRGGRRGPVVYATWEDTVVAFMAPRTGKTTAQAIPFVLSAPGAVIATSNKADLWAATAAPRAAATGGRVWLFDPQRITWQPQAFWWDLLRGLRTVEDAHRLAGHFVLTVADEHRRDLWGPAAQDLLAALFLAASSSGQTLHEVAGWLNEPVVPTPIELLGDAGFTAMAASLRGAQNGAHEQRRKTLLRPGPPHRPRPKIHPRHRHPGHLRDLAQRPRQLRDRHPLAPAPTPPLAAGHNTALPGTAITTTSRCPQPVQVQQSPRRRILIDQRQEPGNDLGSVIEQLQRPIMRNSRQAAPRSPQRSTTDIPSVSPAHGRIVPLRSSETHIKMPDARDTPFHPTCVEVPQGP